MKQPVFFIFIILVFAPIAYGCSMASLPVEDNPKTQELLSGKPLYRKEAVKPTFYVFIGEVVGIVKAEKNEIPANLTDAEGVKIKVTENIYTPQSAEYYEIFPLSLYPDCSVRGQTDLQRSFPAGSKVRVVAFDATIYKKQSLSNSVTRLEVSYRNGGSIVRNDLDEGFRSSANSVFDYAGFSMKNPKTDEERRSYDSKFWLLKFELQKDLARLATTKSKNERLAVLKRLVYYPLPYGLAFKTLAYTYLKPGKDLESLERKWEARKQETRLQNQ